LEVVVVALEEVGFVSEEGELVLVDSTEGLEEVVVVDP
jgi:hypothetical protein